MSDAQLSLVTPEGVRDGDPAALSGLTTRRGAAVLAYAEQVARPGRSVDAAAEAFAQFRRAVVAADDPYDVDPERTLLRGTRFAAAAAAPRELPLRVRLRGSGPSPSACELVPELLAARAEEELSAADGERLGRHLMRCAPCSAAEARFRAGERAYREAPDAPPVAFAARAIMEALLHCAPTHAGVREGAAAAPAAAAEPSPAVEVEAPVEVAAEPAVAPQAAPVALLVEEEPDEFVPEPFDEEPYEYAPEPTVTHVVAAERQETYEFDALPDEAFDLEPEPLAVEELRRRRSAWTILAFVVLAIIVLAALAVVALAVLDAA
jgi:hypothetical protein